MDLQELRAQIFSAQDVPRETVEVPEWGATFEVRGMSQGAREQFVAEFGDAAQKAAADKAAGRNPDAAALQGFTLFLLTGFVYNPGTDDKVFTADDLAAIQQRSSVAIDRLASVAMRLSGLGQKAVDDAGKSSSPPGETTTTDPAEATER